jgi:hypothetical protein
MKGIIFHHGHKVRATVIEDTGRILTVTEDIEGQPCPEGPKRFFKKNQGVWAECRKSQGTGRWNLLGSAIYFPIEA